MNATAENTAEKEIIKKFQFVSKDRTESFEILIAELLVGTYSFYTWPAAKVLAQFMFYMRKCLMDKKILEIGAGTGLPGILAAKLGAHHVTLTDSSLHPKSLAHIERNCKLNKLRTTGECNVKVSGLTWGCFGNEYFDLGNDLDLIIGSDCCYDPSVFEDVIASIAFLLQNNPKATFIFSYQLRSSDWTLENVLKKWHLACRNIDLESVGDDAGIDCKDLMEGHAIYLLEIYRKN